MDLLGEKTYNNYLSSIKSRVDQSGHTFIDMNGLENFSCGAFYDSVHLNPAGAKIFISKLVKNISLSTIPSLASQKKSRGHNISLVDNKLLVSVSTGSTTNQHREENPLEAIASWWLAKAYFEESKPPEIVVLGNSQLGPLLGADAYVYDRLIDITGDHRSRLLEHDMHAFLNKRWKVFVGALPKAMLSDQLAISHALFSDIYKPKLVALAVSPIEFIDSSFPFVHTEAFLFLGNTVAQLYLS